ncbi:uncharacterized protein BO87DRAFT_407606 [Aspergillus neoniger CBS 115656]|uniref:Uncharacterized protein n=1 Tax=Aspergillus neoniger (strain CBS 115656) TaxID=1448310 RepID=A0A318YM12_ASPNB|nr:hypothetical protein BO87DRAFT_407606 [Aspergillus neoniger CBS 115656]PYH33410.1 hypothetical protein BO87DRAFT_407606 [Aspergillus neoniger CBS 115656]
MAQLSGMPNWRTRRSWQSGLIFVTSDHRGGGQQGREVDGQRKGRNTARRDTQEETPLAQKRSEERDDEARRMSRKDIPRCGSSARCTQRTAPGQSGIVTAIKVVGRLGKLHGGKQRGKDEAQVWQGWLIGGLEKRDRMEVGER